MIKFCVFADLHYKKRMYSSSIEHLEQILVRANKENIDFVLHVGDFCNDYAGSPELMRAYHQNQYNLPVYGVYGNHELETVGNSMENVTPLLCNSPVNFGEAENGEPIGYWYTDIKSFRLIGLDSNYSYSPTEGKWEHNRPASYGCPAGNVKSDSLAPTQLEWLDKLLADAAKKNMKAIVVSHACFSGLWYRNAEADTVRAIFAKYPGTVLLAINGHEHTDHFAVRDGVAYFDVNTAVNGYWEKHTEYHYADDHTFRFTDYDENGNATTTEDFPLNKLRQGTNTWFFTEPLSAIVTVTEDGEITVKGAQTEWLYGVEPPKDIDGVKTAIEDRSVKL
ncbi:MAG: metallophosphoesterase [Clostridia bacterium]|nr:metallophosphoesterase [Clostridia bacterium]